jgi:hypothetical protein
MGESHKTRLEEIMKPENNEIIDTISVNPAKIHQSIVEYSNSARLLSTDPFLVKRYENKWIGIYKGTVRVVADTLPALTYAIDNESIPPQETIIRHMDKEEKTLILSVHAPRPLCSTL